MATEKVSETTNAAVLVNEIENLNDITNITDQIQIVISDEMNVYINMYLYIVAIGSIAIVGTLSNGCNIAVFYALGIKNSMSVCLFSLSITDFLVCFIIMVSRACTIWNIFYENEGIDPLALLYAGPAWMADILFLCSGWIVTVLSLERCVCVIFPFKVKDIFTIIRSIVAIVTIYVINIVIHIPIFMTHRLDWISEDIGDNNSTRTIRRLIIVFTDDRDFVQTQVAIFNTTVIPIPALCLTLGSVLWMIYGLNTSTKLRQTMSATVGSSEKDGGQSQDTNVNTKTRKLVQVVLFLAIIFIICSIPRMIAKFIYVIHPEINEGGRGRNLNNLVWQVARMSACLNASVNIVVYLKINTSYQAKFKEIFFRTSG